MTDETGSAVVEFVLVAALLTVLTVSVLQLGLALHLRNTLIDAAAEGARFSALADTRLVDGEERTRQLIEVAVGSGFANSIEAHERDLAGQRTVVVTVRAPLPVIGLVGFDGLLEVSGRAAVETLG
ncbi:TadE family protein [Plantibacter sp. Mn2098]|uniref:TadE family protein n=1 Tax=Plantibacter sp. Mn2098 TaxID=3395266 RepID=UPI003BD3F983